ncbi:hypothetical protein [Smaragdicoccus niigatensis]|uniref:hypothetical protein n=1 Tax=Smaragdicoccus niigatensis TaxID=359359 RepID=UPI00039AB0C1|nr:hypothetical protein [Smaragdicoccus niigatensis]
MQLPLGLIRRIDELPAWLAGTAQVALGLEERTDAVAPRSGGPAGNARLTAWLGLVLLVLFAAEGLTLIDVEALVTWHIAIGALAIPPVLLKLGSTGWRMLGYYLGAKRYEIAGPPPLLLRVAGPFVVLTTIGLLASGVVLILIGQDESRTVLLRVLGSRVDWVTVHQAFFWVWLAVTGLHVLGRLVPGFITLRDAVQTPARVPGVWLRGVVLLATAALGVGCALLLVRLDTTWAGHIQHFGHRPGS